MSKETKIHPNLKALLIDFGFKAAVYTNTMSDRRNPEQFVDDYLAGNSLDTASKITFQFNAQPDIEIRAFQSPRGIRQGNQRPIKVNIQMKETFDLVQLSNLIEYLATVVFAMEPPKS